MSSIIAEVERVLRESGPMSVLDLTIELDAVDARVVSALRSLSARRVVESTDGKWQIRRTPLAQVPPALTDRQRAVLEAVKKWGPIGQTKLAEVTAIPAGSIYAIAAALGGLGLIRQVEGKWVSADDAPIAAPDDAPIAPPDDAPIAPPDDVEDPTEPPSAGGWAAGEPDHVSDGDVVEVPKAEVDAFVPVVAVAPDPVRNDQWVARPRRGPDELGRWYWEARATFERRVARGLGWLAPAAVPDALRGLKQTEVLADPLIALLAEIGALMSYVELTPDQVIAQLSADSGSRDALLLRVRSLRAAEQDVKQIVLRARGPSWPALQLAPAAVPDALRGLKQTEVLADPLIALLAEIGALMSYVELTPDQVIAQLSADSGSRDALLLHARRLRAAEQDVKQIVLRADGGPNWPALHELDVDRAEEAIAAIERKAAAWRKLLGAARELRDLDPQALHGSEAPHVG